MSRTQPNPPAVTAFLVREIERAFAKRETARKLGAIGLLAIGLPALFLGPFFVTCIYWMTAFLWGFWLPWSWIFVGSFIVLTALLIRMELRTKGEYYTNAIRRTNPSSGPTVVVGTLSALTVLAANPQARAGLIELFLWGPRQILEGARTLRVARAVGSANRSRAGALLLELQKRDHAEVAQFIASDDIVIAYLLWYGWIGAGKESSKVWISSEARDMLKRISENSRREST